MPFLVRVMLLGALAAAEIRAQAPTSTSVQDQGLLDQDLVHRRRSVMLLFDPLGGAPGYDGILNGPIRTIQAAPTSTSRFVIAEHVAEASGVAGLAVGDQVVLRGGRMPRRDVRGTVVARRHFSLGDPRRPTGNDRRWGWAYLIRISLNDRNPNSRFDGWLEGFVVRRDSAA
jgi:hypothetical protein